MAALHRRSIALLPMASVLLSAGWAGTLPGAAGAWGAAVGHGLLLAFAAAAAGRWRDPLRLGRAGALLPAALVASVGASWWASPVPRAGMAALVLLPAVFLLPAGLERCWESPARRRWGVRSLALVYGFVSAWALASWWWLETPGASLPLGHHNLLAAWLVLLLPVAWAAGEEGGGWGGVGRVAGALGVGALVATRSLAGAAGLAAVMTLAARRSRGRRWLLGGVLAVALVQLPRVVEVASGEDLSSVARWGYWQAGWSGWSSRPLFGWGPGAAHWTLHVFLRPVPGVHPADQVVSDLHSLPLGVAYELGASGGLLLAVVVAVWVLRRHRGVALAERPEGRLVSAGLLGLTGFGVTCLGGLPLSVPAIPMAVAAVVALVQSSTARPLRAPRRLPVVAYLLVAVWILGPLDLAHYHYDAARQSPEGGARRALERAVALDPGFPLYGARLAALDAGTVGLDKRAADRALEAAQRARGLAPLWLLAGELGSRTGAPWAEAALLEACERSPLGSSAPFRLAMRRPGDGRSVDWGARAILAEPRLLAAVAWQGRQELRRRAVNRASRLPGVDAGWRQKLSESEERVAGQAPQDRERRLRLLMDGVPAESVSLLAFRRRPWPLTLVAVPLEPRQLEGIDLPPATALASTDAAVFATTGCGLPPLV